jgi:hypothetical protein
MISIAIFAKIWRRNFVVKNNFEKSIIDTDIEKI